MFMVLSSWQSHCESSPGSFDECRTAPSGRQPKTKPNDLGCESACTGCQSLHPPSPFIVITQPESGYSFYHPTDRRLSWPSWLVTYRDGLPVHRWSPILVLTWDLGTTFETHLLSLKRIEIEIQFVARCCQVLSHHIKVWLLVEMTEAHFAVLHLH